MEQVKELFLEETEYYKQLIHLMKKKVKLYSDTVVFIDEESGNLHGIKGKLIFREELQNLCEPAFSQDEIAFYQKKREQIQRQQLELRKRAIENSAKGNVIALEYLCRIFHLDVFEYELLAMSLAVELDQQFERVFVLLQDDYALKFPSLDLCIRMWSLEESTQLKLQQNVVSRLDVLSNLFEGIEKAGEKNQGFLSFPLKLDRRILLFLRDISSLDSRLKSFTKLYLPGKELEPCIIREDFTQHLQYLLEHTNGKRCFFLSGVRGIGKKHLLRHFAKQNKRSLLMVQSDIFLTNEDIAKASKFLIRESLLLGNAWICFTDIKISEDEEGRQDIEKILWEFQDYQGMLFFTSCNDWKEMIDTFGRSCLQYSLPALSGEEREILWRSYISKEEIEEDLSYQELAGKYQLSCEDIKKSIQDARLQQWIKGENCLKVDGLFEACQKQLVYQFGKDATKVNSLYTWSDLVLEESQKNLLRDACNQVFYRSKVYHTWGFDTKVAYGRGISLIFYGPPGTGKTMGAQVMANELHLELYKVNMASVMSRYVGDSEKKLEQIFEQGKKSQSILFFDEADVLFGKRSETKDAQDKYANASTAYLLQKIEEYEGIVVLATNFLQNFDPAFRRRFQFIVEFPFPNEKSRYSIWENVFPKELHMEEDIDIEWLAEEFKLSGSQIKNIVVSAAFLAAGEQRGMQMKDILVSLGREQLKVGKQMLPADFGKYYDLMIE